LMADGQPWTSVNSHPGHADRIAMGPIWHNHYMLKSLEEFRAKQARGALSDSASFTRLTDDYFWGREPTINLEADTLLQAFASAVRQEMAAIEQHSTR
jgi:hypothetical protein